MIEDSNGVVRGKLSFVPTDAGIYSEGFIAIKNGEKYGYYNSLGDHKFWEYVVASNFTNGKAAVCQGEKWRFADKDGNIVIDCQFFDADYFNSERNCLVKSTHGDRQTIALKVRF